MKNRLQLNSRCYRLEKTGDSLTISKIKIGPKMDNVSDPVFRPNRHQTENYYAQRMQRCRRQLVPLARRRATSARTPNYLSPAAPVPYLYHKPLYTPPPYTIIRLVTHCKGPAPITGVDIPLSKLFAPPKSWLDALPAEGADSSSPCPLVAAPLPAPPACAAVAADTGGAGTGTAGGTTVGTSVWAAAAGGGGGTAFGTATPPPAGGDTFAAAADLPVGDQAILEMSEEGDRIETGLLGLPHPDRAVGGVPVRRCC